MYAVSSGFLRLMRSSGHIAPTESMHGVGLLPALFIPRFIALVTPSLRARFKGIAAQHAMGEPRIAGLGGLLPNGVA